jgi:epoxyqueuosine reductase QueG
VVSLGKIDYLFYDELNEPKCVTCPAQAIKGNLWDISTLRDEIVDPIACRKVARRRAMESFGIEITQCGKCIEACPYTRKYLMEVAQ